VLFYLPALEMHEYELKIFRSCCKMKGRKDFLGDYFMGDCTSSNKIGLGVSENFYSCTKSFARISHGSFEDDCLKSLIVKLRTGVSGLGSKGKTSSNSSSI
jgi:hypothetical protein